MSTSMLPRDVLPGGIRRLDYEPSAYVVDAIELAFDLDAERTQVSSRFSYRRNSAAAPGQPRLVGGHD